MPPGAGIDVYMVSNFVAEPYRELAERLGARDFFDKSRISNAFGKSSPSAPPPCIESQRHASRRHRHPTEFKPMPQKFEVSCASCNLRELCLPAGLSAEDVERVENIVYARRRVKRGETLFNAGAQFSAVYAIRSGFFKTSVLDGDGREQVTGFFMGGELVGLDGLGSGAYNGTAVALEDSEVCVLPYALIEEMSREPALQRHLHTVLAREIVRDHGVMLLLGSMRAEERLATFLLNLSKRFVRRYSASDFHLRMRREGSAATSASSSRP